MSLKLKGYLLLPAHIKPGGFDHAAVHAGRSQLYVAHTCNDTVDVIDCGNDRYLHSIPNLTGVAGALVSDDHNLIFTSNRGEDTVSIFSPDDETGAVKQYLCQLCSRNWFKSGMNHAQTGNLLENLSQ